MKSLHRKTAAFLALCLGISLALPGAPARGQDKLRVVTTLTTYADMAREIAGDLAEITPAADGRENVHHIQPKPSLVILVKRADMLVTTGLDLEMWLPSLLDKANNPKVASGAPGFVSVSNGIDLLDIPESLSRSEGESHKYGNHHIWTDPANGVIIARNILNGFKRVDPTNAATYQANFDAWVEKLMRAYVGDELVDLLGVELLADLDRTGELWEFIDTQSFQGAPLKDRLGGWLKQGLAMRDQQMICYHKQWSYFSRSFGVSCAVYVEPKPGIPPSPRHVAQVINDVRNMHIPVLLAVNYYDQDQIQMVAQRTRARAVVVPLSVEGAPGTGSFIDLMSYWVTQLSDAFQAVRANDGSNP